MSDTKTQKLKQRLISAALGLAEQGQWQKANLAKIAKAANTPLSEAFAIARSKSDLISFIEADLTNKSLQEVGDISEDMSTRDVLFDLLMTRFELMNTKRGAYLAIMASTSNNLDKAATCFSSTKVEIRSIAETSGIDTSGSFGSAKTLALTYMYLDVLNVWRKDESEDLSETMKKLDTELSKAEKWALEIKNFDLASFFRSSRPSANKADVAM